MEKIKGIGASNGVSIAKIYKLEEQKFNINQEQIDSDQIETILNTFQKALTTAQEQIKTLKENAIKNIGEEKAEVFEAHISILNDPEIANQVDQMVKNDLVNLPYAFQSVTDNFINLFTMMDDPYMKERAADIKDVRNRVLKILLGLPIKDLSLIDEEVIIIAHDLTPSETSQLNPQFVKGFITEIGGRTSHSAIMARTLEIPAVVGAGDKIFTFNDGAMILLDGNTGDITYEPSEQIISESQAKIEQIRLQKIELEKFKTPSTISKDGFKTEVAANIGSPADALSAKVFGPEGVGLFRTEFLYMDSDKWPSEDEQFNAYKEALEILKDQKVVIRTLDIGGDKHLSYFDFPKEMNPFLGYRAVRLQLDKPEIMTTQVRALLRASAFGKLAINIPMIATVDEFKNVKAFFEREEAALKADGVEIGKYELGIMVEIPAVVEMADIFAKHADFFSIGTNDLIQYTFAADRMSEKVSYLYQPFSPAILRKIKRVIDASHQVNKWTAVCGEMAGEPKLAPILLGMGLDEFSMSATSIPSIRRLISLINKTDAQKLVEEVLNLETQEEVLAKIDAFFAEHNIEIF